MTEHELPARINARGRPALVPLTAPLSVHLLTNTNRGTLTADAEGVHRGRTTIVGDVRVGTEDDRLIARLPATQLAPGSAVPAAR